MSTNHVSSPATETSPPNPALASQTSKESDTSGRVRTQSGGSDTDGRVRTQSGASDISGRVRTQSGGSGTGSPKSKPKMKKQSSKDSNRSAGSPSTVRQNSGSETPKLTTAERRANFKRQPSSERQTFSSPDRGLSRQGSRRSSTYRRMSSFDFAHTDSLNLEPDLEKLQELDPTQVPWWTSQRFGMSLMWFFGFVCLYAQRVNLSIAIVSMVDHSHMHHASHVNYTAVINVTNATSYNLTYFSNSTPPPEVEEESECPEPPSARKEGGEFHWNKQLQGLILGSFFWGYLVLQVPGGWLSEKFGSKKIVAVAMFPVAIFNILSPVCARASPYLFLVVRVIVGLGEGVLYPAAQAFWSKWAPPNERSRLIGFSYAGGQFGNAIIFPIGGFLCAYGFDGGWPSVFYVIGSVGFIWCVFWCIFAHDTPAESPRISEIEKKYIEASLGNRTKSAKETPWKSIFTSRAVWAIIIAHMCGNYGAYMLLTQIPTYMKDVLKFDIKANGVFSMLPYLCFWMFITISGTIADLLISKEILSVAWTRKLMSCIGTIGPGTFLIATGFMECTQQTGAVVMLTAAVGLCGFHFSGYFINHGDVAPPYAGTIFGITNSAATVPGIIAPYVVGAMTPDGTRQQWQSAFYVAAAIYYFGAIYYTFMGRGEVQPWAEGDDGDDVFDDEEEEMNKEKYSLQPVEEGKEEDDDGKPTDKLMNKLNKDGPVDV